jgi:glutamyl-tRNA reductase
MEETKDLYLLGVSFRTAPVAVREALSFNRTEAAALLQAAAAELPGLEALILSTCNRTEFYLAAPPDGDAVNRWLACLRQLRPAAPILDAGCARYQASGAAAARHLFRVACGLDSAILGDVQILGQLKEALSVAAECGTIGGYLNQTLSQALRAGKRARSETSIGRGAASLGSALAGMLEGRLATGQAPAMLIIGAGEIARDIGRHLAKRRLGHLTFINRTDDRAADLARHCGGQARGWGELRDALEQAEVVIAATAATAPILQRATLDQIAPRRAGRPLLVIDAGMPRNVETGSVVEVIDLDAIRERQEQVLEQRQAAGPAVESLIAAEARAWEGWRAARSLESAIKLLYQEAATLSRETAACLSAPNGLTRAQAEHIVHRSFKHLLHAHVSRLRGLTAGAEAAG